MKPKFRAWYGAEMYDEPVIHNGEFYLDWRDFIDGDTYDGAVLMQSTGLFDSSLEPVEIYKDDIVTKSLPNGAVLVGVVTFTKGMFLVDGVEAIDQSWVVIGNIHEHPQLLEELSDG